MVRALLLVLLAACTFDAHGVTDAPEDPGSTGSGCSSIASSGLPSPTCGDGVVDPGEICDDGNEDDHDACLGTCAAASCGDGILRAGLEECDDGNVEDGDGCTHGCRLGSCEPSGARAALVTKTVSTTTGCLHGNPCSMDEYTVISMYMESFQSFGEEIVCSGPSTCVAHIGIATHNEPLTCQGRWEVFCDNLSVGEIDTIGKVCDKPASQGGCAVDFAPRPCASVRLVAVEDGDSSNDCCGGRSPDSMIVAVSAW